MKKKKVILVGCFIALTCICFAEYTIETKTIRTTQPEQYKNERERFKEEAPPQLYQQYISGKQMFGFGLAVSIAGEITAGTGAVIAIFNNMFNSRTPKESIVLLAIGGVCLTTGIPLIFKGVTKKRNAYNTFRKDYPAKNQFSNFQLNLYGNGFGLAYVF